MIGNTKTPEELKEFRKEFSKRFFNFCKTAPLLLNFHTFDFKVDIHQVINSKPVKLFEFNFDFTKTVKENIYAIKQRLKENYYPSFRQEIIEESDYSTEELTDLVQKGEIDLNDVMTAKKKQSSIVLWVIDKIFIREDSLILTNLTEGRNSKYKIKMPVTIFLRNLTTKYSESEISEVFFRKAELIKEL